MHHGDRSADTAAKTSYRITPTRRGTGYRSHDDVWARFERKPPTMTKILFAAAVIVSAGAAGAAIVLGGGYLVLAFGPDIDASYFGF